MTYAAQSELLTQCGKVERIVLVGAGKNGKAVLKLLKEHGLSPICFFSNFPEKDGAEISGVPVVRPHAPNDTQETLYVLTVGNEDVCDELREQLLGLNVPGDRIVSIAEAEYTYYASLTPDEKRDVLSELYRTRLGREMNWDAPQYYSEILNWEKLNTPEEEQRLKTRLADKLLVRDYVRDRVGERYLSRVYKTWERADDIDFDALPNSFVLKCNHGSGMNILVPDKKELDRELVKKRLNRWISRNYAYISGMYEAQYANIPRRILCEEYLEGLTRTCPQYNVFCFHGEPRWICRLRSPHTSQERGRFYDTQWHAESFYFGYPLDEEIVPKPDNLNEALSLAGMLSKGLRHVRVDLYELPGGKLLFSELTFSSWAGLQPFVPNEFDELFGRLI